LTSSGAFHPFCRLHVWKLWAAYSWTCLAVFVMVRGLLFSNGV
jgi:hypothetical protein